MQDLSGFSVPKGFRGGNAIKVQLWWAVQSTIFAWSPQVLYRWRAFLLRLFGAKIGKKRSYSSVSKNYLSVEINLR
ncbi:colanic acid biosynthesis acetyltransferase WcaF [Escherichia coli]|nr:colanic acid biosynthesis acetyltransferase WcaF [Escherichia coli]